jgi:penicillin-binding protein 2
MDVGNPSRSAPEPAPDLTARIRPPSQAPAWRLWPGERLVLPVLTIRDKAREALLVKNRALIAMLAVVLLLGVLVSRLYLLQVVHHRHFSTLSEENRVNIVPIPPNRGVIYDRHGVVLAQNQPSFSLELVPEAVRDMGRTLDELAAIVDIRPVDLERFHKLVRRMRRFEGVPLRFHLTEPEVARFAINRHRFPGVDIQARLTRHYPLGPSGVHAIGYVGRIDEHEVQELDPANYSGTTHVGKVGAERAYEDMLHGRVGYRHVETNAQGRTLRVLEEIPPVSGQDLQLSIDASLQLAAEQTLGEENGAIVAIDPRNGEVLALASTPVYDPNLFVNGIEPEAYAALQKATSRPLYNRALRGVYPPGSTIKPFMAMAGRFYKSGLARGETWCRGFYQLKGNAHRYRDWKKEGHGAVDLSRAIMRSCDVYFYQLALDLGIDRMHEFMSRFGFGRRSGIDIGGEQEGLMPSKEWKQRVRHQPWYPGETLITGIGQGYMLVTPIQLASATATLSQRGRRLQPKVGLRLRNHATGQYSPVPAVPAPALEGVADGDWEVVIRAMVDVVHTPGGTALKVGQGALYRMAGKTGTAQVFGLGQDEKYDARRISKKLRDHGLFVAFAPAEDPRIAVAVVVENGGSGSGAAAPLARRVFDHYLLTGQGVLVQTDLLSSPRP